MTLRSAPAQAPTTEKPPQHKANGPRGPSAVSVPRSPGAVHSQPPARLPGPRGSSALPPAAPGEAAGPGRQDPRRLRHFVLLAARPAREPKMAAERLRRSATAKLDLAPIPHRRGDAAAIFNLPHPPPPNG